MIRRILCPTELTQASHDSLAYAFRLAKENDAQLIVFHAAQLPTLGEYPCDMDDYFQWQEFLARFRVDRLLEDAQRRLTNFVRARFDAASIGIDWKAKVALGDTAEEIVRVALQEEADVVVMHRCKTGRLAKCLEPASPRRSPGARLAQCCWSMRRTDGKPRGRGDCPYGKSCFKALERATIFT